MSKTSFLGLLDGVQDQTVRAAWWSAAKDPGGMQKGGLGSELTNVSTTTGTKLPRKPGGARKTSVEKRTARRRIRRRISLEGFTARV